MIIWFTIALVTILIIGLILYWQLILAEGAYLGAPLVALLYDWTAERYNKIKDFNREMEAFCLGRPLANRLCHQPEAMVLDVATGTGRVPLALFDQPLYQGKVIGLDRASKMLNVARRDTATDRSRITLIQADAMALPFADNSFPLVTCLEALEFLPNPQKGLAELIRVLQPASKINPAQGWLLVTHRIGWEVRLMPGKTWRAKTLVTILKSFPLQHLDIRPWEDIYNLVWAQKVEH
ncbi:MAG: class I SAM-dependent methyltransferase [Anaerolineae bacterium]|nr:class I SAM-dependent methyltransferase [Anaerolineae bacterium]